MSDLISRQAAIDALQNLAYNDWNKGVSTSWGDAFTECAEIISGLPSAQPEQKTGEWKPHQTYREWDVCSACGIGCKRREYGINPDGSEYVTEESYRYCPNCGAKML